MGSRRNRLFGVTLRHMENVSKMNRDTRTPGIVILALFFVFGTLASGLAALMLLLPGTPLDVLWHLNLHAREGFLTLGRWAVLLMLTVCFVCAAAAVGLWLGRRWGFWTAIVILTVNLVADTISSLFLQDWRTLIGLPIAGLMIAYLLKKRTIFIS